MHSCKLGKKLPGYLRCVKVVEPGLNLIFSIMAFRSEETKVWGSCTKMISLVHIPKRKIGQVWYCNSLFITLLIIVLSYLVIPSCTPSLKFKHEKGTTSSHPKGALI